MQNPYQGVVTIGIVALFLLAQQEPLGRVGGALIGKGDTTFKNDIVALGKTGLGAALLAMLAGVNNDLGKIALALVAGLWLLYLMHPGGPHERASRQPQTPDQLFYGTWPLK